MILNYMKTLGKCTPLLGLLWFNGNAIENVLLDTKLNNCYEKNPAQTMIKTEKILSEFGTEENPTLNNYLRWGRFYAARNNLSIQNYRMAHNK